MKSAIIAHQSTDPSVHLVLESFSIYNLVNHNMDSVFTDLGSPDLHFLDHMQAAIAGVTSDVHVPVGSIEPTFLDYAIQHPQFQLDIQVGGQLISLVGVQQFHEVFGFLLT